jgi:2'-5' RNA ligase
MAVRCFVALEIPGTLREHIGSMTGALRASGADARWVPAENLHLTLKFLGNVREEGLSDIRQQVAAAAALHGGFGVRFEGMGVFPGRRRPRVVWIGVSEPLGIVRLQRDIQDNLALLGYLPEKRPYTPHLTLGRVRSQRGIDSMLWEIDALRDTGFGEFRANSVSLMKSELRPSGAEHACLHEIPLGT